MSALSGKRAVLLVADGYQLEETMEPKRVLEEQGAEVIVAGLGAGPVTAKGERGTLEVRLAASELQAEDFDLLIIPGGAAPERLRLNDGVLALARGFMNAGKPVAAICHGPQVLISARVLAGRQMTCYEGIRDDVRLAGARYRDQAVVVDRNLVTSRTPDDLPVFLESMLLSLGFAPAELIDADAD